MEITWLGHSSVRINSRDIILVTDPYDTSEGTFMTPQNADIVTVSNDSPKHSHTSSITGNPHLVHGPGEYEISHFYITGTGTSIEEGDDTGGKVNTFYTIRAEGLTLCHLGALSRKPTPAQLDRLRQTQILIAPVSGKGILTTAALQEIISSIQPRVLIPVQHGDGGPEELEGPERFLTNIGVAEPPPSSNRLTINETNLPADMRINLLNRQT